MDGDGIDAMIGSGGLFSLLALALVWDGRNGRNGWMGARLMDGWLSLVQYEWKKFTGFRAMILEGSIVVLLTIQSLRIKSSIFEMDK